MFKARLNAICLLAASACALGACSSHSANSDGAASTPDAGMPSANVGCGNAGADTYAAGMKKLGAAGQFSFELMSSSPAPPALNDNTFVVQVSAADGTPVTGDLSVALDMPEHGHPSPEPPTISYDAAANAFTLDPMHLFMVGLWRITFSFTPTASGAAKAAAGDSVVYEFCID